MKGEILTEYDQEQIQEGGEEKISSLSDYFKGISKTPLLSPEEERKIAIKLKKERDRFIKSVVELINIFKKNPELLTLLQSKRR